MQDAERWLEDRSWEHRLPAILLSAFAVAGAATLLGTPSRSEASAAPVTRMLPETLPIATPVPTGLVPLQIADVLLPEGTTSGVVLLEDKGTNSVLPVFLNASESAAVRSSLQTGDPQSSPDLLGAAVRALGGQVQRVELSQGTDEAVSTRVVLRHDHKEVFLDARPAEALALAAATHAPVYSTSAMLDAQGIRRETVDHLPGGLPSRLRNPETF